MATKAAVTEYQSDVDMGGRNFAPEDHSLLVPNLFPTAHPHLLAALLRRGAVGPSNLAAWRRLLALLSSFLLVPVPRIRGCGQGDIKTRTVPAFVGLGQLGRIDRQGQTHYPLTSYHGTVLCLGEYHPRQCNTVPMPNSD